MSNTCITEREIRLSNRFVKNELKKLFSKYEFTKLDESRFLRSRIVECPDCKGKKNPCKEGYGCDGSRRIRQRCEYVNATRVYEAVIEDRNFMITVFEDSWGPNWFSIDILSGPYAQDERLRTVPKTLRSAFTDFWDEESVGGSGIRRVPDSLRGPNYRTEDRKGDHYRLPEDIVQYLLSTLKK